jgi:hypothetical protein
MRGLGGRGVNDETTRNQVVAKSTPVATVMQEEKPVTEDVNPADVPDLPGLKDVAARDARDDVFPWQVQQLERLGYEGLPQRDHFEAQAFIDRLKPEPSAPVPDDPNDLTAAQLDEMYT